MTSIASKILDLTYPMASMFTGSSFNESVESTFKDRQIEDLWIPFFCITTDLNSSQMKVHTHGMFECLSLSFCHKWVSMHMVVLNICV